MNTGSPDSQNGDKTSRQKNVVSKSPRVWPVWGAASRPAWLKFYVKKAESEWLKGWVGR